MIKGLWQSIFAYMKIFDQKIVTLFAQQSLATIKELSAINTMASKFAGHQSLIEIGHKINEGPQKQKTQIFAISDKVFIERKSLFTMTGLRKSLPSQGISLWLIDNNFSILYMEALGIEEQIHIFKTSRVIAAVHGAALTNMGFCKSDTVVIEIHHEDPRAVSRP